MKSLEVIKAVCLALITIGIWCIFLQNLGILRNECKIVGLVDTSGSTVKLRGRVDASGSSVYIDGKVDVTGSDVVVSGNIDTSGSVLKVDNVVKVNVTQIEGKNITPSPLLPNSGPSLPVTIRN